MDEFHAPTADKLVGRISERGLKVKGAFCISDEKFVH